MFKALCISCRYSSLSAAFPALTRLASVMVFSSPKCTSCVSNGVEVTRFKRPLKYFFLRFLRTSSSLISRTSFPWLMDLSILYLFCRGIFCAGRFSRILYWFASNWNLVYAWNSPKIERLTFSSWGLRISSLRVPRLQRWFGFVLRTVLVDYFLCSKSTFHLFVPPRSSFFASIRHTDSFLSKQPGSKWSYSCFQQLPLHLLILCEFQFSEQGRCSVCESLTYILVDWGLPLY